LRNAVDDFAPMDERLESAVVEHFLTVRERVIAG
jgi:hypothetical protein